MVAARADAHEEERPSLALVGPPRLVVTVVFSKEAIANLLELPVASWATDAIHLAYTDCPDGERCSVSIRLTDERLPSGLTQSAGGFAAVCLCGTRVDVWGHDAAALLRAHTYLAAKLRPLAYEA
jgi:hypothetical protein